MSISPDLASSYSQADTNTRAYRPVRPLPAPLLDHATVCFEEELYSQAFSLLTNALSAGTGGLRPAHTPSQQHIALAATLAVHPALTTRTSSVDKHVAADDALRYLRLLNRLTAPVDSGIVEAFKFRNVASSRSKRARTRHADQSSEEDDDKHGRIRSMFVTKESLWSTADDFWSVLGWAFNCSVTHRHRWERWKLWLLLTIEVLEEDFECRARRLDAAHDDGEGVHDRVELRSALLMHYLGTVGEGRNRKRRIMRAILADGSPKALAEFGEIWKDETKPPRRKKEARRGRKRQLDLDQGNYGDYDEDSDAPTPDNSSQRSGSTSRRSRGISDRAAPPGELSDENGREQTPRPSGIEGFGGVESVMLRQRLLALLVRLCATHPEGFLDVEDLFDLYAEFLRALPLPVFQRFVLPLRRYLDEHFQASLDQMLLRPLLDGAAPAYKRNELTQADFELYYAPFAANVASMAENAKVGLLVEDLLRLLWKTGGLTYSDGLRSVVVRGISARRGKAEYDGRIKSEAKARGEEASATTMEASAARMIALIDMSQRQRIG